MEVRVADAKTTTALEQDGSLRCLLKIKYKHRDRHSVPAIAWAKRKVDEVSRGLLEGANLEAEAESLTICVNLVHLGEYHHSSWVCWDLYLAKCTSEARDRIDQSTREPIYMVSKRGDVLIARRAPRMDHCVAQSYERAQESDSGPRPYFRDDENPPIYLTDTRQRWEAPWGAKPYDLKEEFTDLDDADDDGKRNEEDDGKVNAEASVEEPRPDSGLERGEGSGAQKISMED